MQQKGQKIQEYHKSNGEHFKLDAQKNSRILLFYSNVLPVKPPDYIVQGVTGEKPPDISPPVKSQVRLVQVIDRGIFNGELMFGGLFIQNHLLGIPQDLSFQESMMLYILQSKLYINSLQEIRIDHCRKIGSGYIIASSDISKCQIILVV